MTVKPCCLIWKEFKQTETEENSLKTEPEKFHSGITATVVKQN